MENDFDLQFDNFVVDGEFSFGEGTTVTEDKSPDIEEKADSEEGKDNDTTDTVDLSFETEDKSQPDINTVSDKEVKGDATLHAYYDFLKQQNILDVEEGFEFDGTEESLVKAQEQTQYSYQKKALEAVLSKLPENLQDMAIYALKGGTDFSKFNNQEIEFNTDTIESQTEVLKKYYKETAKWDNNRIEKYLSKLDETEIKEEADEAIDKLNELSKSQREALIEQQKQIEENQKAQLKDYNDKLESGIKNANFVPIDRKPKLKNFMFNTIRKEDGAKSEMVRNFEAIQKNPEHLIQLADLLMDYDKEKGIAYTRFEKKSQTTLNKGLKKALEETVNAKVASFSSAGKTGTAKVAEIDWSKFEM
jgi:hypothetical protein